jgi:hypothetical protein
MQTHIQVCLQSLTLAQEEIDNISVRFPNTWTKFPAGREVPCGEKFAPYKNEGSARRHGRGERNLSKGSRADTGQQNTPRENGNAFAPISGEDDSLEEQQNFR